MNIFKDFDISVEVIFSVINVLFYACFFLSHKIEYDEQGKVSYVLTFFSF